MRAAAPVVAILVTLGGTARAGTGIFVPPAKMDFGAVAITTQDGVHVGSQWLIGVHLATIYPRRIRFDIGAGYVGARFDNPFPAKSVTSARVTIVPEDATLSLHGGYLELSHRIAAGRRWRTWLSGRGELSSVGGEASLGSAARISGELWKGVRATNARGAMVGVLAIGFWAEASARELGDRRIVGAASAGLSVRIPLFAVVD